MTAIDDFGAGYGGIDFLAALQPGVVRIDVGLVRVSTAPGRAVQSWRV